MKRNLLLHLPALAVIILLGNFVKVWACSCVPNAPCQSFGRADVVFVGKVVGSKYQRQAKELITVNEGKDNEEYVKKKVTYDIGEIYFEVSEAFHGAEKNTRMTIHSNTGGGDCGFPFKRGETYVVFASREGSNTDSGISSLTFGGGVNEKLKPDANRLWTTICAGTSEIKDAAETLSYLRNLPKTGSGGTIVGRIDESIKDYTTEKLTGKPYPNVKIKAQQTDGEKKTFYGMSNNNGYFEINVPVGTYDVTPILEPNITFANRYSGKNEPVKIEDRRCESKIFWAENDSEISGKIVKADGSPAKDASLMLIPADKERLLNSFENKLLFAYEGEFGTKGIPLGRYQIALNYTDKPDEDSPYPTYFYPNTTNRSEAKIFVIGEGTKFKDLVFTLPPELKKRKIQGTVVWKDGKTAVGAEVALVDSEFDRNAIFNPSITNAKGEFSMEWFEGRRYKIKVVVWKRSPDKHSAYGVADAETEIFTLDGKTPNFKIILDAINPDEKSVRRTTVRSN